jgi:isoquinoline 1-oxidoreductase beta subunit
MQSGNDYDGLPKLFKVNNVWMALDCYLSVNPGQLQAQLVGGMVHALNAVLYGRQSFVNGVPQFSNFYQNRVIRLDESPQVAVTLIPSPAQSSQSVPIGGAGEIAVPTLAPALTNAYVRAGGTRIRTLPIFPTATMGGLENPNI